MQPHSVSSSDQAIRSAIEHHSAGRLREAEAIYRQVLANHPQHADALHLLGALAHQIGKTDTAIELIRGAIASNPAEPVYHTNLGKVFASVGRPDEAVAEFQKAVALKPGLLEAHCHLGIVLRCENRLDEAVAELRHAAELAPESPAVSYELGICLKLKGDLLAAAEALRKSIALKPDSAEAFNGLAGALRELGNIEEAETTLRQAISIKPDFAEAQNNLGSILQDMERNVEAIAQFRIAIALQPDNAVTHYNLGTALFAEGQFDEAIACFQRVLVLKHETADVFNNLGNALRGKGDLDGAESAFRRAIQLQPGHSEAHNNLSNVLLDKGRIDDAIVECRRGVDLQPDNARLHHNLGMQLLLNGQFEQGWAEHEWRVRIKEVRAAAEDDPRPRWDGAPLAGMRILVYAEQGFGDTIQFSRYLTKLISQCGAGEVIFQVPKELARLVGSIPGVRIVPRGQPLPEFDIRCPLLSLPMHFKSTLATIADACKVPYLHTEQQRVDYWRERLKSQGKLKVGLVWAGRSEHKNDRNRSIPLRLFAPLFGGDGATTVRFFSLQKGPPANQIRELPNETLIDWTDELDDFTHTAALIEGLDLVISVDTSIAHLAGAMGKTVWTLLPFAPDWRWLLKREDSPWYPTMKLFRQPKFGDWETVIQNIIQSLKTFRAHV